MTISTVTLGVIAAVLFVYAWRRQDGSHLQAIKVGWQTLRRTLLLLVLAFVIVGYIEVLSPHALIEAWIGPQSGLSGILVAEFLGLLLPGGPYVVFPLIAALYAAGAGVGPTVTMITSWATLALISVTFELPFMGWRFTSVRWGLSLAVPFLTGLAAQFLFGG